MRNAFRLFLVVLLTSTLVSLPAIARDAPPDLSGTWQLNREESDDRDCEETLEGERHDDLLVR